MALLSHIFGSHENTETAYNRAGQGRQRGHISSVHTRTLKLGQARALATPRRSHIFGSHENTETAHHRIGANIPKGHISSVHTRTLKLDPRNALSLPSAGSHINMGARTAIPKEPPLDYNLLAQNLVEDILTNPKTTLTLRQTASYGSVVRIESPLGQVIFYSIDMARFIGFRE